MRRFMRFDHLGNPIGEVSPNDIMEMTRKEEINGEHSLEITTFQVLNKNERIIYQDGRGYWREYVVVGVDEEHAARNRVVGTYYCVWSVMPDLMGVPVSVMPGVRNPVSAGSALSSLLSTQARWMSGTVTQTATGGASMYDMNAWKALGVLVENWGGELSTTIEVGAQTGVTARKVNLYNQLGTATATRRFDFGADLKSVKRRFADAPMYCRISPRGAGEQSGDGYGRKIRITDVNGGKDYLEYAPMVDICKLPSGSGYIYPTVIVENPNCKTPAELLAWAQGQLEDACTPKVAYDVDVIQAGVEGVDLTGVSLGDTVHIVDRYFGDGLRLSGRIVSMTVDELDEKEITVKVGNMDDSLTDTFGKLASKLSTVSAVVQNMNGGDFSTADYLSNLVDRLNAEINATGGYTYITQGQGLRTYDRAVSDPEQGSEARAVVEVKGGTIRIANSKDASGNWIWQTVARAGELTLDGNVTVQHINTGFIGSQSGNYWNLDTGELRMMNATFEGSGGRTYTASDLVQAASDVADMDLDGITEAAAKLSDLQVGGPNLLVDTDAPTIVKVVATENRRLVYDSTRGTRATYGVAVSGLPDSALSAQLQCIISAGYQGKPTGMLYYASRDGYVKVIGLANNQTYTMSCWAQGSPDAELFFQCNVNAGYGSRTIASEHLQLSTGWRRYAWTFKLSEGSNYDGVFVSFLCCRRGEDTTESVAVNICGMKLEMGSIPTAWEPSREETVHNIELATQRAVAPTKQYADNQIAAYDASITQKKVFDWLTQSGRIQGITLDRNGDLYINGSYIAANTLSANIVKTGLLMDQAEKNKWNLQTGVLKTGDLDIQNASISGMIQMKPPSKKMGGIRIMPGTINAMYGNKKNWKVVGCISPSSFGLIIQGGSPAKPSDIFINAKRVYADGSKGYTGKVKYCTNFRWVGSSFQITQREATFKYGLLVKK